MLLRAGKNGERLLIKSSSVLWTWGIVSLYPLCSSVIDQQSENMAVICRDYESSTQVQLSSRAWALSGRQVPDYAPVGVRTGGSIVFPIIWTGASDFMFILFDCMHMPLGSCKMNFDFDIPPRHARAYACKRDSIWAVSVAHVIQTCLITEQKGTF